MISISTGLTWSREIAPAYDSACAQQSILHLYLQILKKGGEFGLLDLPLSTWIARFVLPSLTLFTQKLINVLLRRHMFPEGYLFLELRLFLEECCGRYPNDMRIHYRRMTGLCVIGIHYRYIERFCRARRVEVDLQIGRCDTQVHD